MARQQVDRQHSHNRQTPKVVVLVGRHQKMQHLPSTHGSSQVWLDWLKIEGVVGVEASGWIEAVSIGVAACLKWDSNAAEIGVALELLPLLALSAGGSVWCSDVRSCVRLHIEHDDSWDPCIDGFELVQAQYRFDG